MSFFSKLNNFGNTGVKAVYQPWEVYLTRKLNFLFLVGCTNITLVLIIFLALGFTNFTFECILTLAIAPSVPLLNIYKNYIWAAYAFYIVGIVFFSFLMLRMGIETYAVILYFPILISLVQILGRRETIVHMFIIMVVYFISIAFLLVGYKDNFMVLELSTDATYTLRTVNIIMSFLTSIMLISVVTVETNKQEKQIRDMLNEKEVLVAEVFHRVKNNMNIVTSLLNLKKHSSDSKEVQDALEDCRNRVFSMALVHQKIYSNKNTTSLNFKEYIHDLAQESIYSFGGEKNASIDITAQEIELALPHAIPCGLILNELITNSFKHGKTEGKKLELAISLQKNGDQIELTVRDNGPGISESAAENAESLGMELIRSLSEQIDGKYVFSNENGFKFDLKFKN